MKTNIILHGDCRERLSDLPTESVDLIYLDPPFFSNKEYESQMNDGTEKMRASFDDRWAGGIDKFIEWIRPAISECYRILKPTGSIFLHCDHHAESELDVLLKDIFIKNGTGVKRDALRWCYKTMGSAKKYFPHKNDTILFYTKTQESVFNIQRQGYEAYSDGVKNRDGKLTLVWGGTNRKSVTHNHPDGPVMLDYWTDISAVTTFHKEYTGYPTQKPEKLLDRIIKASSNKGDLVLDPFMGSGTTLAVAAKLERQFIGIDHSVQACKIAKKRLGDIEVLEHQEIEVSYTYEPVERLKEMNAYNFERWVCDILGARHIGGTKDRDGEMKDGTPIEVKTWKESEKIGRAVVQKLSGVAIKSPTKKGILVGWDFSKEAVIEVGEQRKAGIEIELVKVEDLRKQ